MSATIPPEAAFAIEEVARFPRPGTAIPTALDFDPEGKAVTFLFSEDGSLTRQLYAFDIESSTRKQIVAPEGGGITEDKLSLEEKLRRERTRELGLGVTRYAWSKQAGRLLIPVAGGISVQDGMDGTLRPVVAADSTPALDPRFSSDGTQIAYVRDAEIYIVPATGGTPRQLTQGARGTGKTNGLADFIAQEEMRRHRGYWWSSDDQYIAYTAVDETHIPTYRIMHQGKDQTGSAAQEDHAYPFAGAANPVVRLAVIPTTGGAPKWMDLGMEDAVWDAATGAPDIYLARVHWMPDGRLFAEIQNRAQTQLDLVQFDINTGTRTGILSETSEVWINLHNMFRAVEKGTHAGGFIWASERTGFMHLYLYDRDGKEVRALTSGNWMVDSIAAVDGEGGNVYFTGTRDGVAEQHLYAVSLEGGEPRRLTPEPGMHSVKIDRSFTRFTDIHTSLEQPPKVTVRNLADGQVVATLYDEVDPRVAELGLTPPELVTVKTRDGVDLDGVVYRPPEGVGKAPYPTIVSVYGGPHAQRVMNNWYLTADMRAQYLRSMGYLVFKLDNRGSARRGLQFEGAIRHDMGNIEVQDQVDGVRWLVSQQLADPKRVGIYGWSYGGYMSVMSLARAPETFQVAVAGAPVSHWDGYDTHYTERYMGTPKSNPEGYERSSLMYHAENISGKLLLVHGLIDENVHFRHTARLINALIKYRKEYDLLLFPDERHTPRKLADRVYMEEQIRNFFVANL